MAFPLFLIQSGAGSIILIDQDFSAAAAGNLGSLSLFGGKYFQLQRASAATVQTSVSTVDTTPTTDQARIGDIGLGFRGLVLEEAQTNFFKDSRDITTANWQPGVGITSQKGYPALGPDGALTVCHYSCSLTGTQGNYYNNGSGVVLNFFGWWSAITGSTTSQGLYYDRSGAAAAFSASLTSSWQQFTNFGIPSLVSSFPCFNGTSGGAHARSMEYLFDLTGLQGAVGTEAIGTEAIVTSGGTATRAADHLSLINGRLAVDSGQINFYYKFIAKAAASDYNTSNNWTLFWIDAQNLARIDGSTRHATVECGNVATSSVAAVSFNKYDLVEFFVRGGGGQNAYFSYRVNGGAATVLINAPLSGSYNVTTGSLDVCCQGSSLVLTSWLQQFTAFSFGNKPVGM